MSVRENISTLISLRENILTLIPVRENISDEKTKCGSNERSRHDGSIGPKIVKIGAILGYFWPC